MKVIRTDNFDMGRINDSLVEENLTRQDAQALANRLNAPLSESSPHWHLVVEDSYKLFIRTE